MSLQGVGTPEEVQDARMKFNQFVQNVRLFIRDFPELNRLVSGVETSDRMIAYCVVDAISDFNSTPPLLSNVGFLYIIERGWGHLLKLGTVVQVLTSVGILQTRNHLPFSDGGLNVAVSDKTPLLQSWIQLMQGKWEAQKQQVKVAMNVEQAMGYGGGVVSEYFDIYWFDL